MLVPGANNLAGGRYLCLVRGVRPGWGAQGGERRKSRRATAERESDILKLLKRGKRLEAVPPCEADPPRNDPQL